ncbi:MAG: hypothetical protein ACREQ2_18460 [Candidatus Binatia bacterium]
MISRPRIHGKNLPAALRGGLWLAAAALAFTVMTALIRETAKGVRPFEIAFFRALVSFDLTIPFAVRGGGARG